jgi:ribonuclease HI
VVFTDSQYAIGVVARNWKAKANLELVGQARSLYRETVKIEWVRGHDGHPHQERADKLANKRQF